MVEPNGIPVDPTKLADLQAALDIREAEEDKHLIKQVPGKVRLAHAEENGGKGLKFSRPDLVRDTLFSADGFKLKPRQWTKSTMKLPDDQKVASTSAKEHLPYFTGHPKHGPFVSDLIDFQRLSKLRSTYVGVPEHTKVDKRGNEQHVEPTASGSTTTTGASTRPSSSMPR